MQSELEINRKRKEKLATPHENPKQHRRINRVPCVRKAFCTARADASWLRRFYSRCVQRTRVAFNVFFSATCLSCSFRAQAGGSVRLRPRAREDARHRLSWYSDKRVPSLSPAGSSRNRVL